jgi:heptosyltransferase-3
VSPATPGASGTLVLHPGALGDLLQAVPALLALRRLDSGAPVTLAAQPRIARWLANAGVVDVAASFDGFGLEALFAGDAPTALRSRLAGFARVVSWFGSRDDAYPRALRALCPRAAIAPPVPDGPGAVWEHLVATLAPWGVGAPSPPAPLTVPDSWRDEAMATLAGIGVEPGRRVVVIHPGAGGASKLWPAPRFLHALRPILEEPGIRLVLHQGPADEASAREVLAALRAGAPAAAVTPLVEPTLSVLAAVLARAAAYLGADSGVSHLAACVGTPAVILFQGEARARWAPWSPTATPLTMTPGEDDAGRAAAALHEALGRPGRHRHGRLDSPPTSA